MRCAVICATSRHQRTPRCRASFSALAARTFGGRHQPANLRRGRGMSDLWVWGGPIGHLPIECWPKAFCGSSATPWSRTPRCCGRSRLPLQRSWGATAQHGRGDSGEHVHGARQRARVNRARSRASRIRLVVNNADLHPFLRHIDLAAESEEAAFVPRHVERPPCAKGMRATQPFSVQSRVRARTRLH